jgi:RNA recognition motif-containing protein
MNRKLYVGNLPFEATETELQALFATAGTVASVDIVKNRDTGRPRGFAFVEMATDADALSAISCLDDSAYGGRNITVNEARPVEQPSGPRAGFGARRGNRRW